MEQPPSAIEWIRPPEGLQPTLWLDRVTGRSWAVTVHWAEVDGRAVPVGFDLRSFVGDQPVHGGLAEVTRETVRRLPVAGLIEESLDRTAWALLGGDLWEHPTVARALTARDEGRRRRGRPHDHDDRHYRRVAALYLHAVDQGGATARKPAKYVQEQLEGQYKIEKKVRVDSPSQVRKWIAEARRRGYLPPPSRSSSAGASR